MAHGNAKERRALHELCRRRLVDDMVRPVLLDCSSDGNPAYIVLIVDKATLRVVREVFQNQDLQQEGIRLVELIENAQREALPMLHAIYFLMPTERNIQLVGKDTQTRTFYNSFHIFFAHKLPDELLAFAATLEALARVRSFAEINLSFLTFDSRAFHFDDRNALSNVLMARTEGWLRCSGILGALQDPANRLATLLASLSACRAKVRYSRSTAGTASGAPELFAALLKTRLDEIEEKRVAPVGEEALDGGTTVLILDRSFDWTTVLVHDWHYEALLHDLLGGSGGPMNLETCYFKTTLDGEMKEVALGEEKDPFMKKHRHFPFWEVSDIVNDEIAGWTQKDGEMRTRAPTEDIQRMSARASSILQELPDYQESFVKLQVHSDICSQCYHVVERQRLVRVGDFEQTLLTGVEPDGKDANSKSISKELEKLLKDPGMPGMIKFRLLVLYFATSKGWDDTRWPNFVAALPDPKDRTALISRVWPGPERPPSAPDSMRGPRRAQALPQSRGATMTGTKAYYKQRVSALRQCPRSVKLRRWVPRLCGVLEELAHGRLDTDAFPELGRRERQYLRDGALETLGATGQIVVFFIGGVSLPEVRVAHEAVETFGFEVFVGGSCIVEPRDLLDEIRRQANMHPSGLGTLEPACEPESYIGIG